MEIPRPDDFLVTDNGCNKYDDSSDKADEQELFPELLHPVAHADVCSACGGNTDSGSGPEPVGEAITEDEGQNNDLLAYAEDVCQRNEDGHKYGCLAVYTGDKSVHQSQEDEDEDTDQGLESALEGSGNSVDNGVHQVCILKQGEGCGCHTDDNGNGGYGLNAADKCADSGFNLHAVDECKDNAKQDPEAADMGKAPTDVHVAGAVSDGAKTEDSTDEGNLTLGGKLKTFFDDDFSFAAPASCEKSILTN